VGSININITAAGYLQLATGRFSMGESRLFLNKGKNKSQLIAAIPASCE